MEGLTCRWISDDHYCVEPVSEGLVCLEQTDCADGFRCVVDGDHPRCEVGEAESAPFDWLECDWPHELLKLEIYEGGIWIPVDPGSGACTGDAAPAMTVERIPEDGQAFVAGGLTVTMGEGWRIVDVWLQISFGGQVYWTPEKAEMGVLLIGHVRVSSPTGSDLVVTLNDRDDQLFVEVGPWDDDW